MITNCRLCGENDRNNLIENETDCLDILAKVSDCFAIKIDVLDSSLSIRVCTNCSYNVESSYSFKESVIRFQNELVNAELEVVNTELNELSNVDAVKTDENLDTEEPCDGFFGTPQIIQDKPPAKSYITNGCKFTCRTCKSIFTSKTKLFEHLKSHGIVETSKHLCQYCAKVFMFQQGLKEHILNVHTFTNEFKCPICTRIFTTSRKLSAHKTIHTQPRNVKCKKCDKKYRTTKTLNIHMKLMHTEDYPFTCEYCDWKFKLRQSYRVHLRKHTGEKPYRCPECIEISFTTYSSYKHHMNNTHGVDVRSNVTKLRVQQQKILDSTGEVVNDPQVLMSMVENNPQPKVTKKPNTPNLQYTTSMGIKDYVFRCVECPVQVRTVKDLKNHFQVTHKTPPRFACNDCEREFTKLESFRNHVRGHRDKYRYCCEICGKYSARGDHHEKHLKTHAEPQIVEPIMVEHIQGVNVDNISTLDAETLCMVEQPMEKNDDQAMHLLVKEIDCMVDNGKIDPLTAASVMEILIAGLDKPSIALEDAMSSVPIILE